MWNSFLLFVCVSAVVIVTDMMGMDVVKSYVWFKLLTYSIPIIVLTIHLDLTLTLKRAAFFFFLASSIGTIFEYIGLKYGTFFGGNYVYESPITLFTVPVDVILYWTIFIYTGYSITNSFLYWLRQRQPSFRVKHVLLLLLEIFLDGIILVSLDLFMDPLMVKSGAWTWIQKGDYFGIPIGNFIGWFIVTIIVTGTFRLFEYFYPRKVVIHHKSIFIVPVLFYGILALTFCFKAIQYNMNGLALVGSMVMLPIIIVNLYFFEEYETHHH